MEAHDVEVEAKDTLNSLDEKVAHDVEVEAKQVLSLVVHNIKYKTFTTCNPQDVATFGEPFLIHRVVDPWVFCEGMPGIGEGMPVHKDYVYRVITTLPEKYCVYFLFSDKLLGKFPCSLKNHQAPHMVS